MSHTPLDPHHVVPPTNLLLSTHLPTSYGHHPLGLYQSYAHSNHGLNLNHLATS